MALRRFWDLYRLECLEFFLFPSGSRCERSEVGYKTYPGRA